MKVGLGREPRPPCVLSFSTPSSITSSSPPPSAITSTAASVAQGASRRSHATRANIRPDKRRPDVHGCLHLGRPSPRRTAKQTRLRADCVANAQQTTLDGEIDECEQAVVARQPAIYVAATCTTGRDEEFCVDDNGDGERYSGRDTILCCLFLVRCRWQQRRIVELDPSECLSFCCCRWSCRCE